MNTRNARQACSQMEMNSSDDLGDFRLIPSNIAFAVIVWMLFVGAVLIRFGVI